MSMQEVFPLTDRQRKIIANTHAHANLVSEDGTPQIRSVRDGWKKMQQMGMNAQQLELDANMLVRTTMAIVAIALTAIFYAIIFKIPHSVHSL